MQRLFQRNSVRFGLSLVAVYIALVICSADGHFQIDLADPATLLLPFYHRCGLLLAATLLWAIYQTIVLLSGRPNPASTSITQHGHSRR